MGAYSLSLYDTTMQACSLNECFILRVRRLSSKLLKQEYLKERLKSSFRKFYGRHGILFNNIKSFSEEY